ncbi:hypothetical protein HMPREF9019_0925 [Hoylesella timonensis CRIS 5C-B1]|uniref:Uncharacterized protein n=2 Tax=Hoylesella timonensis TaxID=386414 RepID=D1VXI9_9BACT|nr:hypothetical protein HMPREF9019_0925 [Hoylesella timonensis CRIS 5C-B1]
MSQSELKNAPWNEVSIPAIERDCEVTETISKRIALSTTDYSVEEDWNDEFGKCTSVDTSETDWNEEYSCKEYTVLELIDKLKAYVEVDIKNTSPNTGKGRELQRLLSACSGWEQVESEVEEC